MPLLKFKKKVLKLISKIIPGNGVRIFLLRQCGYDIGKEVYIGEDIVIIDDMKDPVNYLTIGDRVAISPRVTFVIHSRPNWSRIADVVNSKKEPIKIKEDAWIGTGAVLLPGVEIGRGAVVGANSVVTQNVPDYTVVGGVPAHKIKKVPIEKVA